MILLPSNFFGSSGACVTVEGIDEGDKARRVLCFVGMPMSFVGMPMNRLEPTVLLLFFPSYNDPMIWLDSLFALVTLVSVGFLLFGLLMVVLLRVPAIKKRFPAAMRTGLRALLIGGVLVAFCVVFINWRGAQFRVTQKHLSKEVIHDAGS